MPDLKLRNFLTFLLLTTLGTTPLLAGNGTGSADFLTIPVDSRGSCLRAASVALAEGSAALFHNPASIGNTHFTEFSLSHSELYQDLRLENISVALPLANGYGIGFAGTYLGYGEIAGYNVEGEATGNVAAHSAVLTIGLSRRLSQVLSLGVAVKPVFEELGGYSARTVAYDLGLTADWGRLTVGAQYANLGSGLQYISERTGLPRRFRVGAAVRSLGSSSTVALAVTGESGGDLMIAVGLEYGYGAGLVFRGSYQSPLSGQGSGVAAFAAGIGLDLNLLHLDYSYRPGGELDEIHQITATFSLGR